jgi:methionyl-tRNA formyltransferase
LKYNTIFFGTPEFSIPTLKMIYENPAINLCLIVSMPDRPAGRGQQLKSPPAIEYAKSQNISFLQTENINKDENLLAFLHKTQIDIFIVLAFAQFFGEKLLSVPAKGCFNIHTSLLPKYRGAAPIHYAILNNDKTTGASIQKMVKKMDAGDIAHENEIEILPRETTVGLSEKLSSLAATTLNQFIDKLIHDKIVYKNQNETNVSFAPSIPKEDGRIFFSNYSAFELDCRIRAFESHPGCFCFLNGLRLKIYKLQISEICLTPGELKIIQGQMYVGTKDFAVHLTEVQLEGKKRCNDIELINGLSNTTKTFTITS